MTQQQPNTGFIPAWSVGDRLRKARETTQLDAADFAEEIGVHRDTIANYEKDRVKPRRVVLNAWALRTGVPVEWLTTGQVPVGPRDGLEAGRGPGVTPFVAGADTRDCSPAGLSAMAA